MAGATHLVEHLTLRSCGDRSRRALALAVDRLGGEVDAWTGSEAMGVSVTTTLDALEEALGLLVDAVTRPTFAASDVSLEIRVTEAELELVADDPAEQVGEALLRAAWGRHPLARPVIGTRDSLRRLTPESLRAHHAELIRPGSVLAAVAGDVDADRVAACLRALPLQAEPRTDALPPLRWRGHHLEISREASEQVHARLGFEAIRAGDSRTTALAVLNHNLGDGAVSRLFQRLREEEGLTYDVWSAPLLRSIGGLLEIGWACAPLAFPDALRLVREEVARISHDLSEDEVAAAKEGLLRGLEMDLESPGARCALDVNEVLDRGRRFDPERARDELSRVTADEIRTLAAELLQPERMASAVCGPEGAAIRVA